MFSVSCGEIGRGLMQKDKTVSPLLVDQIRERNMSVPELYYTCKTHSCPSNGLLVDLCDVPEEDFDCMDCCNPLTRWEEADIRDGN